MEQFEPCANHLEVELKGELVCVLRGSARHAACPLKPVHLYTFRCNR